MSVLGLIPARGGSRRVPGKNLRRVGGVPLVEWALRCAVASESFDRIIVTSDDEATLRTADRLRPGSSLRRPEAISGHLAPAEGYVHHAVSVEKAAGRGPYDVVVLLQPTSPFRLPEDIQRTIDALDRNDADVAVTIVRVPHDIHPAKFKSLDGERLVPLFGEETGRTFDELPPVFVRDGGVYALRSGQLSKDDMLHGLNVGIEVPRERAIDINDEVDLAFAEFMWTKLKDRPEFEYLRRLEMGQ